MKNMILSAIALILIVLAFVSSAMAAQTQKGRLYYADTSSCIQALTAHLDPTPKDNTAMVLYDRDCGSADPRYTFMMTSSGSIRHALSGKCLHPKGGKANASNNTQLVLHKGCDEPKNIFVHLAGGQLKHLSSEKCIHPKGGSLLSDDPTSLVLYTGCSVTNHTFSFETITDPTPTYAEQNNPTVIKHKPSSKCFHPKGRKSKPGNNTSLVLHSDYCNQYDLSLSFKMESNGAIKHTQSGKCIHPKGGKSNPGNNTKLVLHDGCSKEAVLFEKSNGALVHKSSGKCIHPKGGSSSPKNNTQLVLYDGCDDETVKYYFYLMPGYNPGY